MSRSRCKLHFNKLDEFKAFLISRGWVEEPSKGVHERLRMRHKRERDPLILHATDTATEHFTTWDLSEKMANAFLNSTREKEVKAA